MADIIGVTESTIWNWEHGVEPELRHILKIIDFLGYVPFDLSEGDAPVGRLKRFRLFNDLPYKKTE